MHSSPAVDQLFPHLSFTGPVTRNYNKPGQAIAACATRLKPITAKTSSTINLII